MSKIRFVVFRSVKTVLAMSASMRLGVTSGDRTIMVMSRAIGIEMSFRSRIS